ncbi:hypothetical protein K501DRAFT_102994 [Backusella circina FSU 941]|nr:hypothetical protein K501DRAFT_102994 [Backusella circina FSU 941]
MHLYILFILKSRQHDKGQTITTGTHFCLFNIIITLFFCFFFFFHHEHAKELPCITVSIKPFLNCQGSRTYCGPCGCTPQNRHQGHLITRSYTWADFSSYLLVCNHSQHELY